MKKIPTSGEAVVEQKIIYLPPMGTFKKVTYRAFALLLIGLVGLMVANEAAFKHTHHINGQIVTHSHPYNTSSDDKPAQTHHHNKAQILFLNHVGILFPLLFLVYLTLATPTPVKRPIHSIIPVYSAIIFNQQGRDPPMQ